ncbi:MAG: helix-turn-helix transcriptional regulator [Lachnospiraceae bacterium]|nr:helix-turn-helix transcriptional regulator [Lachnospiraceae bacterium]
MGARIKELRKSLGLTQQEFADRLKIKRGTVAQWEIERNEPIDAVVNLICREFHVNEAWLRGGTGEMFIEQTRDEEIAAFIGKVQENPDDTFKKQLISVLAHLTEDQWVFLEQKAKELVGENEKANQ